MVADFGGEISMNTTRMTSVLSSFPVGWCLVPHDASENRFHTDSCMSLSHSDFNNPGF